MRVFGLRRWDVSQVLSAFTSRCNPEKPRPEDDRAGQCEQPLNNRVAIWESAFLTIFGIRVTYSDNFRIDVVHLLGLAKKSRWARRAESTCSMWVSWSSGELENIDKDDDELPKEGLQHALHQGLGQSTGPFLLQKVSPQGVKAESASNT